MELFSNCLEFTLIETSFLNEFFSSQCQFHWCKQKKQKERIGNFVFSWSFNDSSLKVNTNTQAQMEDGIKWDQCNKVHKFSKCCFPPTFYSWMIYFHKMVVIFSISITLSSSNHFAANPLKCVYVLSLSLFEMTSID